MTRRLTFAVDHTTEGGRTYKQGNTYEVNNADARELIYTAKAVDAGDPPASDNTDAGVAGDAKKKG
jgi:hypothetical protein